MQIQEILGWTSLSLVFLAGLFHVPRVWQGIIVLSPVSWFIWFVVSFSLLLSYKSMNAGYELYALIGNVLFPGVNFLLSFRQKTKIELDGWDYGALGLGVISIMLWGVVRQDVYLSQYANYLAISADLCAVIPTARLVKRSPMIEKPLPWILFAGAFMIDIFAIKSSNPANYILPVYMVLASGLIAYLQIAYRVKNSIQEKWY